MGGLKTWFLAQTNLVKSLLAVILVLGWRLLSLPAPVSETDAALTSTAQMQTAMSMAMGFMQETIAALPTHTLLPSNTIAPAYTATSRFTPRPTLTRTLVPTQMPTATSVPFNQGSMGGGGGNGNSGGGSGCDPAYPTVCIPPPPPDLNCGDISFRRFTVLSPDPHNFDRDGDGVGCES